MKKKIVISVGEVLPPFVVNIKCEIIRKIPLNTFIQFKSYKFQYIFEKSLMQWAVPTQI